MTNEAQLESLCLEWFQDTGWSYLDSSAMAPTASGMEVLRSGGAAGLEGSPEEVFGDCSEQSIPSSAHLAGSSAHLGGEGGPVERRDAKGRLLADQQAGSPLSIKAGTAILRHPARFSAVDSPLEPACSAF